MSTAADRSRKSNIASGNSGVFPSDLNYLPISNDEIEMCQCVPAMRYGN